MNFNTDALLILSINYVFRFMIENNNEVKMEKKKSLIMMI